MPMGTEVGVAVDGGTVVVDVVEGVASVVLVAAAVDTDLSWASRETAGTEME